MLQQLQAKRKFTHLHLLQGLSSRASITRHVPCPLRCKRSQAEGRPPTCEWKTRRTNHCVGPLAACTSRTGLCMRSLRCWGDDVADLDISVGSKHCTALVNNTVGDSWRRVHPGFDKCCIAWTTNCIDFLKQNSNLRYFSVRDVTMHKARGGPLH